MDININLTISRSDFTYNIIMPFVVRLCGRFLATHLEA